MQKSLVKLPGDVLILAAEYFQSSKPLPQKTLIVIMKKFSFQ